MNYSKLIFSDKKKEEEWESLTAAERKFVKKNLSDLCKKMENNISIEMLCHVVNEILERLDKLENRGNS